MYEDRLLSAAWRDKVMSAGEAAALIKDGMTLGTSGFARIGYPKAVIGAVAEAKSARGLTLICGASVGDAVDGALTRAGLLARRYPFQGQKDIQNSINNGAIQFGDIHLGKLPKMVSGGFLGKIDLAILECCMVNADGSFIPTLAAGISNTLAECAEKVILELNLRHPTALRGLHDIAGVDAGELKLTDPAGRIGTPAVALAPEKIAAIVISDIPDQHPVYTAPDAGSTAIAGHILALLESELRRGRLPAQFCIQSGVGAVANAVLDGLGASSLRGLTMYSEVIQDGALNLLDQGVLASASGTSLTLSAENEARFYARLNEYREKIILRPQEISNCGTLIRRFGIVAINTALEADIYGNVNSTHVSGSRMVNGIGGSSDFAHSAGLSVFITPSLAKNGAISCIVPMVTHTDNSEHDVHVLITEQGMADLRGLSPKERAALIIRNCCHPDYRPALQEYFDRACVLTGNAHTPHDLATVFDWHRRYTETGMMK